MTEEYRECCNMDKNVRVSFQPSLLCMLSSENLLVTVSSQARFIYFYFWGPLPQIINLSVRILFFHVLFYQHESTLSSSFMIQFSFSMFSKLFTFTFDRNKYRWISISDLFLHTPLSLQKEVQLKKLREGGNRNWHSIFHDETRSTGNELICMCFSLFLFLISSAEGFFVGWSDNSYDFFMRKVFRIIDISLLFTIWIDSY